MNVQRLSYCNSVAAGGIVRCPHNVHSIDSSNETAWTEALSLLELQPKRAASEKS